ncbi:MAG: ATP-binding cassette domain-containing protein [Lachnospiraceae bacterium]|nr:ATP-binding cassette domain-containing protein [Lachnospiraceae bacterium]
MKKSVRKVLIVCIWLFLWQVMAGIVDNDILLAGPVEVSGALLKLMANVSFYQVCMASLGRILLGFVLAFIIGVLLGILCYRFSLIKEILEPVLSVVKSVPVASFVVLLLIWQGAGNLSVWISFLVVLPNACVSTENGLRSVDGRLKEMAEVFRLSGVKKAVYIYRPAVIEYLISGMEISIGMAFKSGAAAEVIGMPEYSIGERIYMSKIYLDTPGLFAWTLALIVLSFCMEKLILCCLKVCKRPVAVSRFMSGQCKEKEDVGASGEPVKVCIDGVSKTFGEKQVLSGVSKQMDGGACILLMGESGIGKTTLMRILSGLEKPDEGEITSAEASYLFQEDRLLESEFTITNIMLTAEKKLSFAETEKITTEILPAECLYQKAVSLSGGMKRRTALIRTLLYRLYDKQTVLLLDEPFAGLDEENKKKTADFINRYRNGRTMIVATHDETDAKLLGGNIWNIQK